MSELKPYSGARCMCLLTGCNAGPGCPHYTSNCKAHIAYQQSESWVQCTTISNECLGGCRSRAEHDRYNRRAQPAQAGQVLTVDDLWASDTIMALNAELGLSIDQIAKFTRAIEQAVMAKRVPMTDEQAKDIAQQETWGPDALAMEASLIRAIRHAERHHGIGGEKGGA